MHYTRIAGMGVSIFALSTALAFQGAAPITGQWMIERRSGDGTIQLTLSGSNGSSGHFSHSSDISLDQLRGLTREQMGAPSASVRFEIMRDAGTLQCEGNFKNGTGAGLFTFALNAKYTTDMKAQGYDSLPPQTVFQMAVHNVTVAYVRGLRELGMKSVSTDQLMAMSIHGVAIEYIREMKSLGYGELTPDNLVAYLKRVKSDDSPEVSR